jgi:hypothetical protein
MLQPGVPHDVYPGVPQSGDTYVGTSTTYRRHPVQLAHIGHGPIENRQRDLPSEQADDQVAAA